MKQEVKEAIRQLLEVLDSQNKGAQPRPWKAIEHLQIQQSLKILRQQLENSPLSHDEAQPD